MLKDIFYYCIKWKKIITCNQNNYIKIWKEIEQKPKLLLLGNNPDYNYQEEYESDSEKNMNITSMGEIRDFEKETETPQGYSITPNITAGGNNLGAARTVIPFIPFLYNHIDRKFDKKMMIQISWIMIKEK